MSRHVNPDNMVDELFQALSMLSTPEEVALLLDDLCTRKEVEQMAQRLRAAKLLMEGLTYSQVIEQTNISSATLSRVSRCVQYGTGYRKFALPVQKNTSDKER